MTSGILSGLVLLTQVANADPATHDIADLLAALATPQEQVVAFTETRESALLAERLEVSGTLRRGRDGALIRETSSPRPQTWTLTDSHVEMRRPEGHRQRFSLQRAPELIALRQTMLAVLDGNPELLDQHFQARLTRHEADDDSDEGGHWSLTLLPRDDKVAEQVERLELEGQADRLLSLTLYLDDGEIIRTQFAPAE